MCRMQTNPMSISDLPPHAPPIFCQVIYTNAAQKTKNTALECLWILFKWCY